MLWQGKADQVGGIRLILSALSRQNKFKNNFVSSIAFRRFFNICVTAGVITQLLHRCYSGSVWRRLCSTQSLYHKGCLPNVADCNLQSFKFFKNGQSLYARLPNTSVRLCLEYLEMQTLNLQRDTLGASLTRCIGLEGNGSAFPQKLPSRW